MILLNLLKLEIIKIKQMIKIRSFEDKNYKAIFNTENGTTLRLTYDSSKPILSLEYPELLDVSFGTKCRSGCSFCYTSAINHGINYPNITEKIVQFFGQMTENQRPFQVAIGGGGEPTEHPEFESAIKQFYDLGIMPNYTTNGMNINENIIHVTKKYCGGVAVSTHKHLKDVWINAVNQYIQNGIVTNLHIIVGEKNSFDYFYDIYNSFKDNGISYFVLLPLRKVGRARSMKLEENELEAEWHKLFQFLNEIDNSKIAFGAMFYDFILENKHLYPNIEISLYEPEVMSGYLMLDDNMYIRKSSFDLSPKK